MNAGNRGRPDAGSSWWRVLAAGTVAAVAVAAIWAGGILRAPVAAREVASMAGMRASVAAAQGADVQTEGLTVVGEGEVAAAPDQAQVTLGVQSTGTTAAEAMQANSQAMQAVIDAIKRQGVTDRDIRTTAINLTPVYRQPRPGTPLPEGAERPPEIVSYRAQNQVVVRIRDLSKVGAAIDAAVQAGANQAGGVHFGFQDDSALRRDALVAATRNAREKADAIAAAAGVRITGIRAIVEGGVALPPPRPVTALQAEGRGAAAPPVQPGELVVRANVGVTYTYE